MKNILLTVLVVALNMNGMAQTEELSLKKKWKIKTALSFSTGFLRENTRTIQLQGNFGLVKNKIEIRGDVFYFLNSFGDRPRFSMNHQLYAGVFYKFLSDKKFQPYAGFQPGIAMSQSSEYGALNSETQKIEYQITYNPVGSLSGGFEYFGEKWFYLFTEARYIFGKHKSNTYPVFLDEFRVSFGLGFTI
mgnify:CR=1 FL=1